MKAVRWLSDSSRGFCQKPEVRSMVVEFARPMSLMNLLTSFIEYLSVWVLVLSPLKS